ncbi:hypothetical protein FRC08_015376 [Ceratobasidium sp. 394]|nr:hypothetical protein FRC08_015376 [Ceratobasidium sp. 394]KAG9094580.1 hypothetical protein FS749_012182 [Ceratobasidium sp. UAMH 11750]
MDSHNISAHTDSGHPQSAEAASIKLKATVDNLVGDLKSLKKAKTDGQNVRLEENGIFDPKSWPILVQVYELVKALWAVNQVLTECRVQRVRGISRRNSRMSFHKGQRMARVSTPSTVLTTIVRARMGGLADDRGRD